MTSQYSQFPDHIILNGADCFLLQLDQIMWQTSHRKNVCTFVVSFNEHLELEELKQRLSKNIAYQWVTRLRIKKRIPFSLTQWIFNEDLKAPEIKLFQLAGHKTIPENLLATPIDIKCQSPFKIDLVHIAKAETKLIFTWHHVLMDAHGGESFIYSLGLGKPIDKEVIKEEAPKLPLQQRAQIAQEMKKFLHNTAQLPLLSLCNEKLSKKMPTTSLHYRVLSFSEPQSQIIDERAQQSGVGFLRSAFFLAATTCAVAYIKQQREPLKGDVLVPIPLDRRKRGVDTPIIGNQVSFLFYRIPQHVLNDVQACTLELISQMKNLMREDNPNHYLIMMDFLRRMPRVLYRLMLKKPTKGLIASFFYSDTGDSLQNFQHMFNHPITNAIHYPPNMHPPGVTFVFSRFQGALQITLGYMEEVITEEEVNKLFTQLKSTLLGEEVGG